MLVNFLFRGRARTSLHSFERLLQLMDTKPKHVQCLATTAQKVEALAIAVAMTIQAPPPYEELIKSIQLLKSIIASSDQSVKIFKTAAEYLQMRDWYSLRLWLRRQDAHEQNLTTDEKKWLADYVRMWIRQKKSLEGC